MGCSGDSYATAGGRAPNQPLNCLQCSILQQQWKQFGAIIVHIRTSNQPLHCLQCSAAEAVKASLISRGTLHCWGLKAGPCVRPTKQSVAVASSTVEHCRDVSSSALWAFPCGGPTNGSYILFSVLFQTKSSLVWKS